MEKSLGNHEDKAEVLGRLRQVHADSGRVWGKMSAHQMVCHLSDAFRMSLGEREATPIGTIFHRTLVKWIALRAPLTWPRNVRTTPQADQERDGTRPAQFEQDLQELESLIERFTRGDYERPLHPIFGKMTEREWLRWGYLHMDHHLRQFGL